MVKGNFILRNKGKKAKEINLQAEAMRRGGLEKARLGGFFLALILLISCSLFQWRPAPLPSQIRRIEGYASLRVKGEKGGARSKFSFLFQLPNKGRIDVSSFLGKTLYQIIIDERAAFLLVPSKKVYWKGEEEEIIDRFLGFRLNLNELISLLSGQWKDEGRDFSEKDWRLSWILKKDEQGRIIRGQREELGFEVREFFKNTSVVRLLRFHHPLTKGRLKILAINFNKPLKKGSFSLSFLKSYQSMTWAEIEEILNDKN